MPDTKTHAETPIGPLDGTEEVYVSGSGGTVDGKTTTAAIAGVPPVAVSITTGAAPVDADPTVRYYEITTGGTAGDEILNIPLLPNSIGSGNQTRVAHRIILTLKTLTDNADIVKITVDGSSTLATLNAAHNFGVTNIDTPSFDTVGQAIALVWCYDFWAVDRLGTDDGFSQNALTIPYLGIAGPGLVIGSNGIATSDPAWSNALWVDNGVLRLSGTGVDANQGAVRRTFTQDFTATFGAITALTGNNETVTITGLLTTDQVHVACIDAPPSGMIIANARVSASDTLEVKIVTAVALGITLGALNFRLTVIR